MRVNSYPTTDSTPVMVVCVNEHGKADAIVCHVEAAQLPYGSQDHLDAACDYAAECGYQEPMIAIDKGYELSALQVALNELYRQSYSSEYLSPLTRR